jgi:hypothetical protein
MYLSTITARGRSSHSLVTRAEAASVSPGGAPAEAVAVAHAELVSDTPRGRELRDKYDHVIVLVDNVVTAKYNFPDQTEERRLHLEAKAREARQAAEDAAAAQATAQAAADAEAARAKARAQEAEEAARAAEAAASTFPAAKAGAKPEKK